MVVHEAIVNCRRKGNSLRMYFRIARCNNTKSWHRTQPPGTQSSVNIGMKENIQRTDLLKLHPFHDKDTYEVISIIQGIPS